MIKFFDLILHELWPSVRGYAKNLPIALARSSLLTSIGIYLDGTVVAKNKLFQCVYRFSLLFPELRVLLEGFIPVDSLGQVVQDVGCVCPDIP